MVAIPIYVRHSILLKGGTNGRIELTVGPKQSMGKVVNFAFLCIFFYFFVKYILISFSLFINLAVKSWF